MEITIKIIDELVCAYCRFPILEEHKTDMLVQRCNDPSIISFSHVKCFTSRMNILKASHPIITTEQ